MVPLVRLQKIIVAKLTTMVQAKPFTQALAVDNTTSIAMATKHMSLNDQETAFGNKPTKNKEPKIDEKKDTKYHD